MFFLLKISAFEVDAYDGFRAGADVRKLFVSGVRHCPAMQYCAFLNRNFHP